MSHTHSSSEKNVLVAGTAIAAAAIGALAGIMFTPRSGSDMRLSVRRRANDLRRKAQQTSTDIHESAKDAESISLEAKKEEAKKDLIDEADKKLTEK